jgi:SAM-dependent methyltransferase
MSDPFWEDAARKDPLWAILSDPAKKDRGWKLGEFFETGRREISLLLHQLEALGASPRRGTALDFGCGVGRLSQALAPSFDRVTGIDISPTMVRLADLLNQWPNKVQYLLNADANLSVVPSESQDFIYSDVVLQHVPPEQARRFIGEFFRVLSRGGVVVFQLTAERRPDADARVRVSAMPESAYSAAVEVVGGLDENLAIGETVDLSVRVANRSPVAWDQARYGAIRVGNHWLASGGAMLIQDDGRTLLDRTISPGQECQMRLIVQAPVRPGTYLCEIDLVHEGVTWFGDRGSQTFRRSVRVGEALASRGPFESQPTKSVEYPDIYRELPQEPAEIGAFPMYGVPLAEVHSLIAAAGGRCVYVEPDDRGGPEWVGYRYFCVNP